VLVAGALGGTVELDLLLPGLLAVAREGVADGARKGLHAGQLVAHSPLPGLRIEAENRLGALVGGGQAHVGGEYQHPRR